MAEPGPVPILRLEGLKKSYGEGELRTEVLHGIDLSLAEGEFAALIGPSGSGKSTLLNAIGLLERPSEGRILIHGEDTSRLDDAGITRLRGRTLGFVFQFHHLVPAFTALENIYMPCLIDRGRVDRAMRERAAMLLDRVGLSAQAKKRPAQLSGGQQQRVAIARALAMGAPLVLADEPTGNLDTHAADEIFVLLREFNREQRTVFLIVTHDPRLAAGCDRRIELVDKRIVGS
ncbi:MAG: ABC transporter ATP-binding protein [Betaproteobacteria bacterium]|nr:ABC transporter ATP-binding protein [Betaproteobacteria bacterium]